MSGTEYRDIIVWEGTMSEIKTTLKRIVSVSAAAVCLFSALNLPSPDAKSVTAADVMTAFEITEDMQIGWNLGNTLDANTTGRGVNSETSWGCPKATQELMNAIKAKGFNTVRIPTRPRKIYPKVAITLTPLKFQ